MKRVCIVRQKDWPNKNVVRNAEALVSQGYEVDVIALKDEGEKSQETIRGINVYRLPLAFRRGSIPRYIFQYCAFFFLFSWKLSRLSFKKRYDVVEIDNMPDFLVFSTIFPRLLGTKVILYLYENMPELFASTFKKGPNHIGTRLLRLLERLSAGYAHHVIVADGPLYKRVLESHGVPSEKITVVLNVPDDQIFDSKSPPTPKGDDGFRLITHSSILKRYGVQTLIRAVPLLLKDIPELKVDVLGDGDYRPELEKLARELGVAEHIHFTGWVSFKGVPSFIAQADIGVVSMIDDVGLPNKLFEYFALGKPCVASALPSLTYTFDDNYMLFYRPDDEKGLAAQIMELYRSPGKRAYLGSNGQAFYSKCHWQITKHEYLNVYEELLT